MYYFRIDSGNIVYAAIESENKVEGNDVMEVNFALFSLVHEGLKENRSFRYVDGDLVELRRDVDAERIDSLNQLRNLYEGKLSTYTYKGLGTDVVVKASDLQFLILASQLNRPNFFLSTGEGLSLYQINQLLQEMLDYRTQLTNSYLRYETLITNARTVSDMEKHLLAFKAHIGNV